MNISVIVPTYREKDNIEPLVERIAKTLYGFEYQIIIVDDDSPDGTAEIALSLANKYSIKVIKRNGIRGLGSAIMEGLRNTQDDVRVVMDADLQHPPEIISQLVAAAENGANIAIASRYVAGGGVEGWSLSRSIVSRGANLLARPLTTVKDPMSGFFMLTRSVAEELSIKPNGYKILLDILVRGKYCQVKEIPYVFRDRRSGKSKLGLIEYARYIRLLSQLYFEKGKAKAWNLVFSKTEEYA